LRLQVAWPDVVLVLKQANLCKQSLA